MFLAQSSIVWCIHLELVDFCYTAYISITSPSLVTQIGRCDVHQIYFKHKFTPKPVDESRPDHHALHKFLIYFNFNHYCNSEQQPLKTLGKMEFWNWNNSVLLSGKFIFDFIGQSFTVIRTHMSLSTWFWNHLVFV